MEKLNVSPTSPTQCPEQESINYSISNPGWVKRIMPYFVV